MSGAILGGGFLLLLAGVPIFVSLLAAALAYVILLGTVQPQIIIGMMISTLDNFVLMAAPFFIIAGSLLSGGKLSYHIINFCNRWVGQLAGGLGVAAVAAYTLVAAMTGSSIAAGPALSIMLVPGMVKSGYKEGFAAALCATGGVLAPLIPPSLGFILYGTIAGVSVPKLFIAGILPGILTAVMLACFMLVVARRKGIKGVRSTWRERYRALGTAIPILLLPIVVLGGIYGGFVTPTEGGVVGIMYAALIALVGYRTISLRDLPRILLDSALVISMVFMILASASAMSLIIRMSGLSQALIQSILTSEAPLWLLWVGLIGVLLVLGCFFDSGTLLVLSTPLLVPIMTSYNVSPILFGVILVMLLDIGTLTPPFGINLFVIGAANRIRVETIAREIWPFVLVLLLSVIVVIIFPQLALWLPGMKK